MRTLLLLSCTLLLVACGKPEAPAVTAAQPAPAAPALHLTPLSHTATAALTQWLTQVDLLEQAAHALAKSPSTAHLAAARSAWTNSYEGFNHNLVWLLGNASSAQLVAHRLDPLPIQPGYVDALKEWPDSGLINDPTVKLDAASLVQQNQATDDSEVSLGFQVIQFLLWGSADLPHQADSFRAARRAQYLALVCAQLSADAHSAQQALQQQGSDLAKGQANLKARLATLKAAASNNNAYLTKESADLAEKTLGQMAGH